MHVDWPVFASTFRVISYYVLGVLSSKKRDVYDHVDELVCICICKWFSLFHILLVRKTGMLLNLTKSHLCIETCVSASPKERESRKEGA